jgi:membrane fusion protein, multidrug efflux system
MRGKGVAISFIFVALMIFSCGKKEEAVIEKPGAIEGIKTETLALSPVEGAYEAIGTVRSRTTSLLSSKTVGNIMVLHVREGDPVRKGQLLIEIDDRDARAQLQKTQAGLREAEDAQEEIDQNIRAAESARDAAEAGRSLALATFDRYKSLLEQRSVSPQEFDEVQAKLRVAEAEVERASRMLQALLARKNQVRAKQEQVKADITSAQVYAGYSRILSPMDGVVTSKQAEIGLLAAPGVPLLTLEDNAHYRLEVSVEDSMLRQIRLGASAQVSIDALGPREFSGRVAEIVPASDPASRSSTVKIDLGALEGRSGGPSALRSGLYGRARFPVGQRQILKVPMKAILQRGQLTSVFSVDPAHILHLRLIKTGKPYGDQIEVLSGLNEGDRIVVEGLDKAKEGARVQ